MSATLLHSITLSPEYGYPPRSLALGRQPFEPKGRLYPALERVPIPFGERSRNLQIRVFCCRLKLLRNRGGSRSILRQVFACWHRSNHLWTTSFRTEKRLKLRDKVLNVASARA